MTLPPVTTLLIRKGNLLSRKNAFLDVVIKCNDEIHSIDKQLQNIEVQITEAEKAEKAEKEEAVSNG